MNEVICNLLTESLSRSLNKSHSVAAQLSNPQHFRSINPQSLRTYRMIRAYGLLVCVRSHGYTLCNAFRQMFIRYLDLYIVNSLASYVDVRSIHSSIETNRGPVVELDNALHAHSLVYSIAQSIAHAICLYDQSTTRQVISYYVAE
jgi:hypothetical protein